MTVFLPVPVDLISGVDIDNLHNLQALAMLRREDTTDDAFREVLNTFIARSQAIMDADEAYDEARDDEDGDEDADLATLQAAYEAAVR